MRAAHHAGQRDGAAVVGDHDVALLQRAVDAVEGGHPLAPVRAPHLDVAAQLVEVERVQRVAGLQHHVVGDVDEVRDRPHPAGGQADAHRERARPDRQAGHQPGVVARAAGGVADLDVDATPGGQRDVGGFARLGDEQARSERRRHLARDADVRQRVGAVGGDVDLQHLVEQPDLRRQIRAHGGVG